MKSIIRSWLRRRHEARLRSVTAFACDCRDCRGEAVLVSCSICERKIIASHYDSWGLSSDLFRYVCSGCLSEGK